ncbi:NUDIX domain-containing protein [Novosphingobium clariflavum]|uniref:NUDIX domain-containing protein n=1 Tax=Novosphingobium clariflavum TaxID=2029884 RepID=A0ABV6SDW6_9SPHN|nr:NUDIX domain-containing protein [Novosphingobium clariflavum]
MPAQWHRALYRLAHRGRVTVWRFRRSRLEGVQVLALDGQDRVLLLRHSYGSGKWMAPGGGLRRGEDPLAAGLREFAEETGLELAQARLLQFVEEDLHGACNRVNIVAGRFSGQPRADGREIVEVGVFPLDGLPEWMPQGRAGKITEWAGWFLAL